MEQLPEIFSLLADYRIWMFSIAGVMIGTMLGVLPGMGSAVAIAVLTPFTLGWEASHAMAFLGVLYPSIIYGGSVTAILFNIPTHGGSAATMLDGFPLCQQGRAAVALGIAAAASFLGGLAGLASLILFSPSLSRLGLGFGPAENFLLAIIGLSLVATIIRSSTTKGLVAALLGVLLATVGTDAMTGEPRFTFGVLYLQDGVPFVQAVIGLFAVSNVIQMAASSHAPTGQARVRGSLLEGVMLTLRHPRTLARSSLIGTIIGALPGVGIVAASFLAYAQAARASGRPERFGQGEPEGVIAPETANSACIIADLIPTITLGIPGGAGTAVFLGAMTMHGVSPGSLSFAQSGPATSALFAGLLIALPLILVLGLTAAPWFARVADTPRHILVPTMLVLSLTGSYSLRHSPADVLLTAAFGLLGLAMKENGFSPVPMALGLVLGPLAERGFQSALMISDGDPLIFFRSPAAKVLWLLLLAAVTAPPFFRRLARQWNDRARSKG
jgi:putative tricarboxylic transport membrane protein